MSTTLDIDRVLELATDPTADLPPISCKQADAVVKILLSDVGAENMDDRDPADEPDPVAREKEIEQCR